MSPHVQDRSAIMQVVCLFFSRY